MVLCMSHKAASGQGNAGTHSAKAEQEEVLQAQAPSLTLHEPLPADLRCQGPAQWLLLTAEMILWQR